MSRAIDFNLITKNCGMLCHWLKSFMLAEMSLKAGGRNLIVLCCQVTKTFTALKSVKLECLILILAIATETVLFAT